MRLKRQTSKLTEKLALRIHLFNRFTSQPCCSGLAKSALRTWRIVGGEYSANAHNSLSPFCSFGSKLPELSDPEWRASAAHLVAPVAQASASNPELAKLDCSQLETKFQINLIKLKLGNLDAHEGLMMRRCVQALCAAERLQRFDCLNFTRSALRLSPASQRNRSVHQTRRTAATIVAHSDHQQLKSRNFAYQARRALPLKSRMC